MSSLAFDILVMLLVTVNLGIMATRSATSTPAWLHMLGEDSACGGLWLAGGLCRMGRGGADCKRGGPDRAHTHRLGWRLTATYAGLTDAPRARVALAWTLATDTAELYFTIIFAVIAVLQLSVGPSFFTARTSRGPHRTRGQKGGGCEGDTSLSLTAQPDGPMRVAVLAALGPASRTALGRV